jgi:hypothetical protein
LEELALGAAADADARRSSSSDAAPSALATTEDDPLAIRVTVTLELALAFAVLTPLRATTVAATDEALPRAELAPADTRRARTLTVAAVGASDAPLAIALLWAVARAEKIAVDADATFARLTAGVAPVLACD